MGFGEHGVIIMGKFEKLLARKIAPKRASRWWCYLAARWHGDPVRQPIARIDADHQEESYLDHGRLPEFPADMWV